MKVNLEKKELLVLVLSILPGDINNNTQLLYQYCSDVGKCNCQWDERKLEICTEDELYNIYIRSKEALGKG